MQTDGNERPDSAVTDAGAAPPGGAARDVNPAPGGGAAADGADPAEAAAQATTPDVAPTDAGPHAAGTPTPPEDTDGAPDEDAPGTGRIPLDLVGGICLLAIVALFLGRAGQDRLDWIFPRTLSYGLAIIGVYLTVRGLLRMGDRTDTLLPILRGRGVDVVVFSVMVFLYVVLARPVGFWIMSAVTLFAGAVYLDPERTPKRIAIAAVVALLVCVLSFLLLERVFYVPVPRARWIPGWGS